MKENDRKATDQESQQLVEDQATQGVADSHMLRRSFLGLTGAAAGAALLHGCAKRETVLIEQSLKRSSTNPGEAAWRRSICQQCSGGCETEVRTIDGRAKKIEGDPTALVNGGGVCALGHSALQELYHPHRFLEPQRTSGSTTILSEPASWDDALVAITSLLEASVGDGEIVFCCSPDPVERVVTQHLASAFEGSVCVVDAAHGAVEREAQRQFFGGEVDLLYPSAEVDFVLAVGASVLDRWGNPVSQAETVAEARAQGAELSVISQRMSLTSAKADLWLPLKGEAWPLLDALAARARSAEASAELASLAAQMDVPLERLERLAEQLATAKNPLVFVGGEGGSVEDVVAGYRLQEAYGALPEAARFEPVLTDGANGSETAEIQTLKELTQAVATGSVKVVVTLGVDLLGAVPMSWGLEESFSQESGSHLIALASASDATTRAADWILPIQTDLERVQVSWNRYGAASGASLSVADPVVAARGATRHPIDVILAMAAAAGRDVGWKDASAVREALVSALGELGGKTARSVVRSSLRGSGRIPVREGALQPVAAVLQADTTAPTTASPPLVAAPERGAPVHLVLFEGVRGERLGWGRPWLAELPDPISSVMWGSWIELDPHTALDVGVETGDLVAVTSGHGSVMTTAFINPAIRPRSAAMPLGGFDPSAPNDGDPRNLLGVQDVAGAPLQHLMVALSKPSDTEVLPAPIFGKGLLAAEQIPAGWKSHDPQPSPSKARQTKALNVIGNREPGETQ